LYSSLHAVIFTRASNKFPNLLAFKHSSRNFLLETLRVRILLRPPQFDVHKLDLPLQPTPENKIEIHDWSAKLARFLAMAPG